MKQPVIVAGGRRWHGDEMTTFWNDLHDAVEAIATPAIACILSGCTVTGSPGNYPIAAGMVAMNHVTDGFKIARYAGGVVTAFPAYLYLLKNTTNKLYDDSLNHACQDDYTVALSTTVPAVPYLTLTEDGGMPFIDALMAVRLEALSSGSSPVGAGASVTWDIRVNHATQMLLIRGSITVNTAVPDPPLNVALFALPAGYIPAFDYHFRATIMHHGSYPPYDTQGQAFSSLSGNVSVSNANVTMCLRRPASGTYTAYFNAQVPLY